MYTCMCGRSFEKSCSYNAHRGHCGKPKLSDRPLTPVGMRHCPRCDQNKLLDQFPVATKSRDGRWTYCLTCMKTRNETRLPEDRQRHHHFAKYQITPDDFQAMLLEQGGTCKICKRGKDGKEANGRWLAVDHNHHTGKVRGLLCGRCNTLLGVFETDPTILEKMHLYLTHSYVDPV